MNNLLKDKRKLLFYARVILAEFFGIMLLVYLLLYLMEQYIPGLVSYTVNMTWLLIAVVAAGCLTAALSEPMKHQRQTTPIGKKQYIEIAALSIIGGMLVFLKIRSIGVFAIPITLLAFVVIAVLSVMLLRDREYTDAE